MVVTVDVRIKIRLKVERANRVVDTINTALDKYGKSHGYHLILGATPSGNILFGNNQADITGEFIEYLDRKDSTSTSE